MDSSGWVREYSGALPSEIKIFTRMIMIINSENLSGKENKQRLEETDKERKYIGLLSGELGSSELEDS